MTSRNTLPGKSYIYAFSSGRLVLLVCAGLMLMTLSLMLGIRIEKYQRPSGSVALQQAPSAIIAPPSEPVPALPEAETAPGAELPAPSLQTAAALEAGPPLTSSQIAPSAPAKAAEQPPAKSEPKATTAVRPKSAEPATVVKKPEPKKTAPAAQKTVPQVQYAIQVSASSTNATATAEAATLKQKGFPAYVESPKPGAKDRLFRVKIGPYKSRTDAEKAMAQLKKDSRFKSSFLTEI